MGVRAIWPIALLGAALASAGCATAEGRRGPSVVAVTGEGRVTSAPDTALAQVGAEARAPSLGDATADADRRMRAVLTRLRALGVADGDIRTVVVSVDPLPAPPRSGEDATRIAGYRVTNVVEVRVRDLHALGRILDGAVSAGANVLRGVRFTLDKRDTVVAEARARAVHEAIAKARQLADAAGVPLGELLLLTENVSPRPLTAQPAFRALAGQRPGPVEAGQMETVVTVEAHFRIGGP